jgi:DNA-binding NarL/FixJ family response regulator
MNEDVLISVRADLESALRKVDALLAQAEKSARGSEPPPLKRSNGRLTEAGVQKVRTMLDAGCGVAEIARALDISQPSVIQHRRNFEAERPTRKRR